MQRQTPVLANPFLCPDFTLAVGALRPSARVAVLHDGPHLAGFFPFERRGLGGGVPIGHGLNQCQGLIHAPGAEWDPKALLRACRRLTWQFDNLVAGQRPLGRFATAVVPAAAVDLANGFAQYEKELQQKTGKFYREINRKTRRLEEEVGKSISSPIPVIKRRCTGSLTGSQNSFGRRGRSTSLPDRGSPACSTSSSV